MNRIITLGFVFLAVTAFGCKDSAPPKVESRIQSAGEAARADDAAIATRLAEQKAAADEAFQKGRTREAKQGRVDLMRAAIKRWEDGLAEANRTPRFDMAKQIPKLQVIKSDAAAVDADECTGASRVKFQASMDASFEALAMFQKETGESGDATTQKVTQAADLLREAKAETDACLNK